MTAELWCDHSDLLRPAEQAGAVNPGAGSVTDAGREWRTAPASGTERAPSKRSPPDVPGAGRTQGAKARHRATDEQVRKPRNVTQLATLPRHRATRPASPIAKAPLPRGAKRSAASTALAGARRRAARASTGGRTPPPLAGGNPTSSGAARASPASCASAESARGSSRTTPESVDRS